MFSSYFIFNNLKNGKIPAQAGHRFGQLTQTGLVMTIFLDHQIVDDLILTLNLQIISVSNLTLCVARCYPFLTCP